MRRAFQLAPWLLLCGIVALSVVPPGYRTVTLLPQPLEHFAVFLLLGLAFALSYPQRYVALGAGLLLFTTAVELVQLWVPGRHARLGDLLLNLLGLGVGIGLACVWASFARRRRQKRMAAER